MNRKQCMRLCFGRFYLAEIGSFMLVRKISTGCYLHCLASLFLDVIQGSLLVVTMDFCCFLLSAYLNCSAIWSLSTRGIFCCFSNSLTTCTERTSLITPLTSSDRGKYLLTCDICHYDCDLITVEMNFD